ncbi:MAG: ATP-binding cassette domain-containing protein [Thermodesulfobacteriota bacterium]
MAGLGSYAKEKSVGIKIISLHKSFNDNHVLRGLDLEVLSGETLAVIGKSGEGKTVLLRHIIGLLPPDAGSILLDGEEVTTKVSLGGKRKVRMAMVFQSSALFSSLSAGENVALALRENRLCPASEIPGVVKETLAMVGLEGKEGAMPAELSGGMKKRVAIARALAINPDLILYDEPTTGLDPLVSEVIAQLILDLKNRLRTTSILVSHDLHFCCFVADRVAMLHEGKIIEVGTPAEIKSSTNPVVQRFTATVPRI